MKLIKLLGVVILILVVTSVTISNHSLDDSEVVSDLSREIKSLEQESTILKARIAKAGSLTKAAEAITVAGYAEPSNLATMASPGNVALR